MQAINDKHQRLIHIESPCIVLAGGSNLAFGIDSKAIQETLDIPVVNMGLHAGIGLGRILDDIAPFLHPGDILVIAPEYPFFTSKRLLNGESVAYDLVSAVHRYSLIMHVPIYGPPSEFSTYVKNKGLALIPRPLNPRAYTRDGFNEYGDYVKHLGIENQPFSPDQSIEGINQKYISAFFRLTDTFTTRGIQVIITYPGYEKNSFQNSSTLISELDAAFRAKQNITVISSPEDYCFPADYFYDTAYHLNAKGREIRTARLIRDLKHHFRDSVTIQ
ncbi:hypothetical protein FACS1894130_08390 [Spirochaetia bacterium]|nr:hypothetical protein FACS1894130_08390 [Spirochaetia bacterium]